MTSDLAQRPASGWDSCSATRARGGAPTFFDGAVTPVKYNFDQGNAAPETYPLKELRRLMLDVIDDVGALAFDYKDPEGGYPELVLGPEALRTQVARMISSRDSQPAVGASNVLLTSGSVQAIAMTVNAVLEPGDVAFVEEATFPYAARFMADTGADVARIPMDAGGMSIEGLRAAIRTAKSAGKTPKLIYCIPTFQLPTGRCMPIEQRQALLEVAQDQDLVVLEDNVYGDLRYDGTDVPTLLNLDNSGRVVQSDSFSKRLLPGVRLGWLSGSESALQVVSAARQDLGVSQFLARVMTRYLEHDLLDKHLSTVRPLYRLRRDTAVAALHQHCGDVSFMVPEGSFYLWLELPGSTDVMTLRRELAARGAFFRAGEPFFGESEPSRYLRMCFSYADEATIYGGVGALAESLSLASA